MEDVSDVPAEVLGLRIQKAQLVGRVSRHFVDLVAADVDRGIEGALKMITESLGLERALVARLSADRKSFRVTHRHSATPYDPIFAVDREFDVSALPRVSERILQKERFIAVRGEPVEGEGALERELFQRPGVPWMAFYPLIVAGEVFGCTSFVGKAQWDPELDFFLAMLAQVMSSALDRHRVEEKRAQGDRLTRLVGEISRRFIDLPAADIGRGLDEALQRISEVYGFMRAVIYELAPDRATFTITHRYLAPGLAGLFPIGVPMPTEHYAYTLSRLAEQKPVVLTPEALPAEAAERIELLTDPRQAIMVPLLIGGMSLGAVVFESRDVVPKAIVEGLAVIGELFSSALDRERAEFELRQRLRFEEALSEISTKLVGDSISPLDARIRAALGAVGKALEFDRVTVFELTPDRQYFNLVNEWCSETTETFRASMSGMTIDQFGWPMTVLREGQSIVFGPADIPPDAQYARKVLEQDGTRIMATVPLVVAGEVHGCIGFHCIRAGVRLTEHQLRRLRLVGELVADAMARGSAEASLRRSEARFEKVIASALDGFAMVSETGVILEWTPQTEHILGWPRGEMLGGALADVLDSSAGDRAGPKSVRELHDSAHATPGNRLELRCRHRDGRQIPVELSISSIEGPSSAAYSIFIRDITDRKRMDQARREAFEEVTRLKVEIEGERDYLREEIRTTHLGEFVGSSRGLGAVIELIESVAPTSATVLVRGESGVGKELVARAIHARSTRAGGPLVKVNCASIPKELFESEFFGHVRGAFTGAHRDRVGRFELANKGTLFLDEIGEIPVVLQSKLLRVLQEGEFERVGDDRTRRVDVRVVAATNRDLEVEVARGTFRNDLYYRLGVFPIEVPPLRRRPEDILPLARHFLRNHARELGRNGLFLDDSHQRLLESYDWPGNVRELEHVIERAVILSVTPPLRLEAALHPSIAGGGSNAPGRLLTESELRGLERENLVSALERAGWRISGTGGAAEMLGINASTLRDRMRSFDIKKPSAAESTRYRA